MENINNSKPLVAVWSLVYNHEPYLRDYFEGIVMQKTDFPFVAIVHDDCSTDGSSAIIREYAEKYPDIIKPIFETENQYIKGTLDQIMRKAVDDSGAKYIAMCEGDDYWTDPLKLQKQVDFLETHPDIVYTCHRYNTRSGTLIESTHNVLLDK
ncbi:MAG: glycosyltransferase, partial [Muribaculum sp.]|nr:glycosyltransferase [Muribaculum sp.]